MNSTGVGSPGPLGADDGLATCVSHHHGLDILPPSLTVTIDFEQPKRARKKIAEQTAEGGLSHWLTCVRRHHEDTHLHCLLVTGVAVDFGLSFGMPAAAGCELSPLRSITDKSRPET